MKNRIRFLLVIFALCSNSYAEEPKANQNYKIVKTVYLTTVYNSLNNRVVSKTTARAYLEPEEYYKKAEVAFQKQVPPGTLMTIVKRIPQPWYRFLSAMRYEIQLNPDLSDGLDVEVSLNRGFGDGRRGLNSEIFTLIE